MLRLAFVAALAALARAEDCAAADVLEDAELQEAEAMNVQLLQQSLQLQRPPAGGSVSRPAARGPSPAEALLKAEHLPPARLALQGQPALPKDGASKLADAFARDPLFGNSSAAAAATPQLPARKSFFTVYTRLVKYFLLALLIVLLCTLTCYTGHMNMGRHSEFDEELKLERTCCGFCPCRVHPEPKPSDLETWEKSGKELFGRCPVWLHLPKDLGPRQWTWRSAEINLWIQIFISANLVYESYEAPRAVLKGLQLSLAVLMLLAALAAASWVHTRSRNILIHYFFFTLVTKAFYISAKYAVLASFVTACNLSQSSFSGCQALAGPGLPLEECLPLNNCLQEQLDRSPCRAPGSDTCRSLATYLPAGKDVFIYDALELFFFLLGTVPVFLAATARESMETLEAASQSSKAPTAAAGAA